MKLQSWMNCLAVDALYAAALEIQSNDNLSHDNNIHIESQMLGPRQTSKRYRFSVAK